MKRRFAGVDPAASVRKPTYVSVLVVGPKGIEATEVRKLHLNDEVVGFLRSREVTLVAVDSPVLGEGSQVNEKGWRRQDICARSLGARILPLKTPGMMALAERGTRLIESLRMIGLLPLETHPFSAALMLGYSGTVELVELLLGRRMSKGEADAVVAALVAWLHDRGLTLSCDGDPPFVLPAKGVSLK